MFQDAHIIDQVPLQDVDLLNRLNQYFSSLDLRLRQGQGWLIFNAKGPRAGRITHLLQEQVQHATIPFSHFFLPWRDFALTSYLVQVELQQLGETPEDLPENARAQYQIASSISRQTLARMVTADLLIVNGLVVRHAHEMRYLEDTIDRRYQQRLATILVTPEQPHELAIEMSQVSEAGMEAWQRLSDRLYETSLIAM